MLVACRAHAQSRRRVRWLDGKYLTTFTMSFRFFPQKQFMFFFCNMLHSFFLKFDSEKAHVLTLERFLR